MAGRPLVACLSALVLCAWLAGGSLSAGPGGDRAPKALNNLVRWVLKKGADQVLDSRHAVLIGLNHAHALVRVVCLGRERAPDGLKRAIAVAYNPNGSGMEPIAIILFLLDVDRYTARGGFVSGDIYLARLDGELVKASGVDRGFDLSGRVTSYAEMPLNVDSRNIRRDFRRELAFWLQDSVRPRWERP